MATVDKDPTRNKTPWLVRWYDDQGKQRKKGFARKVDADRFRSEVEHSLNVGNYVDPAAGRATFRDYAEAWRKAQPHRPNTAARTLSQLTKHVYPVLGGRPLAAIRPSALQAFVTGLSANLSPGSVRTVYATVRAIFGAAVHDRVIGRDPSVQARGGRSGVKLPELPRKLIVPMALGEVDGLADAMPARYHALVEFDAGTGLRQGELFGVELEDIDFTDRVLTVDRQVQPTAGGGTVVCPLKNKDSYRKVPLGKVMVDALTAHLAEFPAREVEVLDTTGRKPVTRTARFVFADAAGKPLHRNQFNTHIWAPARTAAGLPEVTCHDLRHFFASALVRAGLNPKVVAARLGHTDASMTLRVYAHLWPDDEDRTRQAIDDLMTRA